MDLAYYTPLGAEALLTALAVLVILLGSLMKKSGNLMGYLSLRGLSAVPGIGGQHS